MNRFNNPLKLQQGGNVGTDQLVKIFQDAAKNAQVDPEALVKKAQEFGQNEEAAAKFMQGLQLCAQGDPEGVQFIQSLFTQSHKLGGKLQNFICKHAKGGYVAGCGCKGQEGIKLPNFRYLGEYTMQDSNNPNLHSIQSHGYHLFDNDLAVTTKEGAFRMGAEAGAAYDNEGERIYSPQT